MNAIQFSKFGPPSVLEYVQTPKPSIKHNEILIRVKMAGVNPIDTKIREGSSFVAKTLTLPASLGFDVCGEISAFGKDIANFKVGDQVFGSVGRYNNPSSYAEYCIAKPNDIITCNQIDATQATALPIVGTTAWQALHTHAKIKAGEKVLIHAAAGGVGHIAVQLAKLAGAYVIGTASERNHDFLKSLGADEVIDYNKQNFEDVINDADVVIDLMGGDIGMRSIKALKNNGRLVTVPTITRDEVLTAAKDQPIQAMGILADITPEVLKTLSELVVDKKLTVEISQVLPLAEAAKAHELIHSKKVRGKIVLTPKQA